MKMNSTLIWVIGSLFAVLLLASAIVAILGWKSPNHDFTELNNRVKSWWVMVLIFSLAISIGRSVSIAFFGLISFLALKEYLTMIPTRRVDRRVLFWAYLMIPLQYLFVGYERYGFFIITIPIYAYLLIPMRLVQIGKVEGFLKSAATIQWGLMLTVFCISHIAYLLVLEKPSIDTPGGAGLVLYLVILTQTNDVAQYIWGKSFGKHKVSPTVSPKKTYEGFLGATITLIPIAVLIHSFLTPFTLYEAIATALMINVFGFIGDITVSALKRDMGVKDSGSLLPGHGGILDRIDSLTYTAPIFFHFVRYMHYS